MALVYEPGDALAFQQPFKAITQDSLRLTNKNNSPVAFKVKTTAPKQYCVRPNAGRIEPGDAIEVQVVLQPMKEDPPADFKCRDKFLVQSIQITPEMESMPMTELWSMVEREAKSSISEKKLRVRYLAVPASGDNAALPKPQAASGAAEKGAAPLSSPPAQQQKSAAASQRAALQNRAPPGPSPLAKTVDDQIESPTAESAKPPKESASAGSNRLIPDTSAATSPGDTTMYYATDNVVGHNSSEADAELEQARATIKDLQRQLADCKARLSEKSSAAAAADSASGKPLAAKAGSQLQPSPVSVDGLSMSAVAIISLVAFLVGYFFF